MAAFAGLVNHQMNTAAQALTGSGATAAAAPQDVSGGTGDSSGSSATISANDFLTLLVTEMKNQDPTADTDPNEYINQLVEVNSLQQLIAINQDLTPSGSGSTTSGGSSSSGQADGLSSASPAAPGIAAGSSVQAAAARTTGGAVTATQPGAASQASGPGSGTAAAINQFVNSAAPARSPGNLSIPASDASALRVAHSLDGRRPTLPVPGKSPGSN